MKSDTIHQTWHKQLFEIERDSRYHRARVHFLGQVEQGAMGMLLVFLALSVTHFLVYGLGGGSITLFAGVSVGAFVLAQALGRSSRRHTALLDRLAPLAGWASSQMIGENTLAHLMAEYQKTRADAPPRLLILNALCHNAQREALGESDDAAFTLSPWQRRLAPLCDVKVRELKEQIRLRAHQHPEVEPESQILPGLTCHGMEPPPERPDGPGTAS